MIVLLVQDRLFVQVGTFGKNRDSAYYYCQIEAPYVSLWQAAHMKSCSNRFCSSSYLKGKL